jgi:cytochrome c553
MRQPNGERTLVDHFTRRLACAAVLVTACSGDATSGGTTSGAGGQAGTTDRDAGSDVASGNHDGGRTDTGAQEAGDAFTNGDGQVTGTCSPPDDIYKPIEKLSLTGCVDPQNPKDMSARAVPYEVNSPLWSDLADKTRAFVLPSGTRIHVKDCAAPSAECAHGPADTGKWIFPIGTVMIKNFIFDSKFVETRLFMRVDASTWVGYSYQWNEPQTEATIAPYDRSEVMFKTGQRTIQWRYPSRTDCMTCHNDAADGTLGPDTPQMNRVVGGKNQIDELAAMGLFETAPPKPYKAALVLPYPVQGGNPPAGATLDQRARSYLHANCSFCHRDGGTVKDFDVRFDLALVDTKICNTAAIKTSPGVTATKIMVPKDAASSALWQRMHEAVPDRGRMPQIASNVVDDAAVSLIGDWINSIQVCP